MTNLVIKDPISGARNIKTFLTMILLFFGGTNFFLAGLSSFFKTNFLKLTDTTNILFIPQGIALLFYGTIGLVLSFFLIYYMYWDIGSGYNEFSQKEQIVRIVRRSFPGKFEKIFLSYDFNNIRSIKILLKQGFNPRSNILIVLKDKREIPLFPPQSYLKPTDIEKKAIELSKFLNVNIERKRDL